jgi:geranylgeranyl reductase family protein
MGGERFDAVVIGAGPGGSVAAARLARGGARVALVDKASFPRDKACGDLVGPRGVRVLREMHPDLELKMGEVPTPGDMLVVGPTGARVRLPSAPGLDYPGHAWAIPRRALDMALFERAVESGAVPFSGRAGDASFEKGRLKGFDVAGTRLLGDVVIGADGATSRVAEVAGLLEPKKVLWGFAVRSYVEAEVELPTIVMWEPAPRRALCGYGWIFPGPGGRANLGLGVGTLADRRQGTEPVRLMRPFVDHLWSLGVLDGRSEPEATRLGGWLKMGLVGTVPARDGVLLVGDAAGLVNPLQGEGISHALTSGVAAADAVLGGPTGAESAYCAWLAGAHLPYMRVAASAHRTLMSRPRAVSAACRLVTHPTVGPRIAEGWALFWNELADGAPPGKARAQASVLSAVAGTVVSAGVTARWLRRHLR